MWPSTSSQNDDFVMKTSGGDIDVDVYYSDFSYVFSAACKSDTNQCRICLREGNVPIFDTEESPIIAEAVATFAELEISNKNRFPKHLCEVCYKFIKAAVKFKKRAKVSDRILHSSLRTSVKEETYSEDLEFNNPDSNGDNDSSPCPDSWDLDFEPVKNEKKSRKPRIKEGCVKKETKIKREIKETELKNVKKKLKKEVKKALKPNTKVKCKVCNNTVNWSNYKSHKTLHDPNHKNTFMCEHCGKSYRSNNVLQNHIRYHQAGFPHTCHLCPYKTKRADVLKLHLSTHTGEPRYACTECPRRFCFVSNLKAHTLRHKEPQFKCDSCDKKFYREHEKRRHIEAQHLGVSKHVCDYCGKAFNYRQAMTKHTKKVHKRENMRKGLTPAYLREQMENDHNVAASSAEQSS